MIDAYKIGVSISMASNGEQIIGALVRALTGLHGAADMASAKLRGLRLAALGAFSVMGGVEVLKGLWDIVKASEELNRELERTKQLGGDFARGVDATRLAAIRTAGDVSTITPSEAVKVAREVGVTLGTPQDAIAMLKQAAQGAYVAGNYTGEDQETIMKNLMRVADARGQIFSMGADGREHVDSAKLQSELEAAVKGLILGGGFIKSNDLLQMVRQAGPAAKTQSAEGFYAAGVEAAVQMGASKTGTAEMGLFQEFIGGTMTKKVAEHLTEAGFLKPEDWHSGKSGGVVVNPAVAGQFKDLTADPQKYFTTGDGAAKIKAFADKNSIAPMMAVFQLFGRQTVERLISDFMTNAPQFERARSIFGGVGSIKDQYAELQKNDLATNITGLQNAWTGLMQVLGEQGVPIAIGVLHGLTDVLHTLTNAAAAHPEAAKLLLEFAGAMGALLVVGGATVAVRGLVTMLSGLNGAVLPFGPGGAAAAGMLGVIGVLGRLAGVAGAVHTALALGDPGDKTGSFIDRNIPGAAAADDWAKRHLGIGRTYEEQRNAPGYIPPTPTTPARGVQHVIVDNHAQLANGVVGGIAVGLNAPASGQSAPDYKVDPATGAMWGGQ